jgi:hypothetical protein
MIVLIEHHSKRGVKWVRALKGEIVRELLNTRFMPDG